MSEKNPKNAMRNRSPIKLMTRCKNSPKNLRHVQAQKGLKCSNIAFFKRLLKNHHFFVHKQSCPLTISEPVAQVLIKLCHSLFMHTKVQVKNGHNYLSFGLD